MMTLQDAIAKAAKLIKLSASSEPHEAALAAQRAQEILARYNIDAAALAGDSDEAEEVVGKDVLDSGGQRVATWKLNLAGVVAKANQSMAYQSGPNIGLVGRPSDVEKIKYLYALLVYEIDRLTKRDGKGKGASYCNQYRMGAVQAIGDKLKDVAAKVAADMRAEQTGAGLVRIDQALAKVGARTAAVDAFVKQNMRMRTKTSYSRGNADARAAGYQAGSTLNVQGGARGALAG